MDGRWTIRKWVKWTLLALALLPLLWTEQPALAQDADPVRLSALEISLWPEFDRPELLVIFEGRLADDVPLPAVLTLTMPRAAGEPHAVAAVDESNQRLNSSYDVQVLGDEIKITYTSLEHRAFQFEYYLDALQGSVTRRQFTFSYALDLSVDDLALELQQPSGATNVVLDPPAATTYTGFADLTYYRLPLGAVDAGQRVAWRVSYDKTGSSLGIVAVGVALVLLLGGLWIVGSRRQAKGRRDGSRRQDAKPPQRSKRDKRKDRKDAQPGSGSPSPAHSGPSGPPRSVRPAEPLSSGAASLPPGGFCHHCGAPLKEDGLFCHRCGTPRKGT